MRITRLLSGIAVASLIGGLAGAESPSIAETPQERILDSVVVEAVRPDPGEPKTGEIIVRPVIAAHKRRTVSDILRADLVFTAVELDDSGAIQPFTDQDRQRYSIPVVTPLSPNIGGLRRQIELSSYPSRNLQLPGGTYILSEVNYTYIEPNRIDLFDIPPGQTIRRASYCLSERSFIFDIKNGEKAYLGIIALANLPRNLASKGSLEPIAGVDQNPEFSSVSTDASDNLSVVELNDTNFQPDAGLCADTRYNVAGWQPRSASSSR